MTNILIAGKKTDTKQITVEREAVRSYCQSIGETNDIFLSLEKAQAAGYRDIVLPATYPSLFWQEINIPWLDNPAQQILSEQSFEYIEPLTANITYSCFITLVAVRSRADKQFLKHLLMIRLGDQTVATNQTMLVLRKD